MKRVIEIKLGSNRHNDFVLIFKFIDPFQNKEWPRWWPNTESWLNFIYNRWYGK